MIKQKLGRTFLTADPHFLHRGSCRWTNSEGERIRPFDDEVKMTDTLIENWNEVVHPENRVYILGDISMSKKGAEYALPKLNGRKVLVAGNHDICKLEFYAKYFDDVRACVEKRGFIMTHIPIHPDCLTRWGVNVHGHTHNNSVMIKETYRKKSLFGLHYTGTRIVPDKRYICVSVEQTDYYPIDMQIIMDRINGKK